MEIPELAAQVLGNAEGAQEWLRCPAWSLAGVKPVDLLSNKEGRETVRELLIRIEYGVYC